VAYQVKAPLKSFQLVQEWAFCFNWGHSYMRFSESEQGKFHTSLPKETWQTCKILLESEMVTKILPLKCVDLTWPLLKKSSNGTKKLKSTNQEQYKEMRVNWQLLTCNTKIFNGH
jgi:hypothetical protein